jgi:hypothetical protein
VVNTLDEVFVHSVEELIDFAITKIQEPLDLISETPAADVSEPNDFSEEEEFDSDSEDMECWNMGRPRVQCYKNSPTKT